jgi:hypothetical protein
MGSITYRDVGRRAMMAGHSVFRVHDIPPAMYYGPGIPSCAVSPQFKAGDICSIGLWDETVNQPEVYPFVSDREGFCYTPKFYPPSTRDGELLPSPEEGGDDEDGGSRCPTRSRPPPPLSARDPNKPRLQNERGCGLGCSWSAPV